MAYTTIGHNPDGGFAVDKFGNITILQEPAALAQDAALAASIWQAEVYTDASVGVPYKDILGSTAVEPRVLANLLQNEVLRLPGVTGALVTVDQLTSTRIQSGTIHATTATTAVTVNF